MEFNNLSLGVEVTEKRKTFTSLLLVPTLVAVMFAAACTPQQKLTVVTDIQKFLPVVTNVAEAVCAFTPAAAICVGGVAAVSASADVLDTALVNYFTAEANGTVPPGILAALSQAITTFESDASNILDAVRVLNPALQAEIMAIVAAAQVLLSVIESLLPATVAAHVHLRFRKDAPANFNLNSYVSDYNTKVTACQKYMPKTVKLSKIHIHSAFERIITVGILK